MHFDDSIAAGRVVLFRAELAFANRKTYR